MKYWKLTSLILQAICIFLFLFGIFSNIFGLRYFDSIIGLDLILSWLCLGGIQIIDTLVQLYYNKLYPLLSSRKWHGLYLLFLLFTGLLDSGILIWILVFTSPISAIIICIQTWKDYCLNYYQITQTEDTNDVIDFL